MDQSSAIGTPANHAIRSRSDRKNAAPAIEIRVLDDFEMSRAAGGDGVPVWDTEPPPPPPPVGP